MTPVKGVVRPQRGHDTQAENDYASLKFTPKLTLEHCSTVHEATGSYDAHVHGI